MITHFDGRVTTMCDNCHVVYMGELDEATIRSGYPVEGWRVRVETFPPQKRDPKRPLVVLHEGGGKHRVDLCPDCKWSS